MLTISVACFELLSKYQNKVGYVEKNLYFFQCLILNPPHRLCVEISHIQIFTKIIWVKMY